MAKKKQQTSVSEPVSGDEQELAQSEEAQAEPGNLEAGIAADRGHDADEMQALKDANAALQRANDGLLKTNRQQSDMLKKAREETALARAAQDKLKDRIRELEAAMQGERRIEIKTLTRCFAHNAAGEEDAKLATYLNNGWDIKSTDETVIKKDSDSRYWHYQTVLLTREVGGDQPDPQTTRTGRRFERQADSPLPSLRGAQTDEKPPEAGAFQAALRAGAAVRELTALGNKLALAAGEREYRARTAHIRQPERLGTGS